MKTDIEKPPEPQSQLLTHVPPEQPPDHWGNSVSPGEWHALPNSAKKSAHDQSANVAAIESWRRVLTDPKTSSAAIASLHNDYPLTPDQQAELRRWQANPNRKEPDPAEVPGRQSRCWGRLADGSSRYRSAGATQALRD